MTIFNTKKNEGQNINKEKNSRL